MKITSLFFCLSLFVTLTFCQDYQELTLPANINASLNPCTQNYYTFSVDQLVVSNYLEISIDSNSTIHYTLSTTQPTGFTNPTTRYQSTINVVCDIDTTPTWYFIIANEGDFPLDYNLTISVQTVTITPLTIGDNTPINSLGYDFSSFATSFDFYNVTFGVTPNQFSSLEITITYNDVNNTVESALINFNNLPVSGPNGCGLVVNQTSQDDKLVMIVDYCTIQTNGKGSYYISVKPENETPLSYSIQVANPAPQVPLLSSGSSATGYIFAVHEINFYQISATQGNVLNVTITDVVNGEVEVQINYGVLPFFECVNGGPLLSQVTSSSCQFIVDGCNSISGMYYVGVNLKSSGNPSLPVSYRIFYNQLAVPGIGSLSDNQYVTGAVTQSFYAHYEFESADFDVTDDTLINFHLYVDTYNIGTDSYEVNLYVNYNDPAGPEDSCYTNIEQCTINTATESSCTIQIQPCLFNQYQNWYAGVFAPNGIISNRVIQYSLIANLENPTEITQQYEIISSSVYYETYDHYYLAEDLFTLGSKVNILVTSVSDSVTLYTNDGTIAGAPSCPDPCYNNTGSHTFSTDLTYPVVSCPNSEIDEDFYFSVQGQSSGNYSSYSVMYVVDTGVVQPPGLTANTLQVGSIPPRSAVNFTLTLASFDVEAQLVLNLYSQNTSSVVSATLYNTTYLNCLGGQQLYACTVSSYGYCTFTVPPCVFTTSEGLLISLANSANGTVYYNFEFSLAEVKSTELELNIPVVSQVAQFQYDLYTYEVTGGSDTFIIEVIFFDDGQSNPSGYLNVSTLALGTGPCYPDPSQVTTCESDTKCVYVASSCNLPTENLNIAVYTADNLYPDLPLKYSIVVREFSSVYALPTAVKSNSTSQSSLPYQIYPGQQVYHTFTSPVSDENGSIVTFQLTGDDVIGLVSQNPPPSGASCPCFEFHPDATLTSASNSYTIEYCDQLAAGTYTILVEAASSDLAPAQQLSYTIVATTFSSQPINLALDEPIDSQVLFSFYQYFVIPDTTDAVSITISNIIGGSISIYYSSSDPATRTCNDGIINCATPDSSCVSQLLSCTDAQYVSIYGESADSASPITFSIVVSGQDNVDLTVDTPTPTVTLDPFFTDIYSFTLEGTTYVAPVVTFSLSNVSPANANYQIQVFTNDYCSNDFIFATPSATVSISYCQILDEDLFFYVVSADGRSINYTATVTVVDVYTPNNVLQLSTPQNIDLPDNEWITFEYDQPALDPSNLSSLTFSVLSILPVPVYFSFNSYPAPLCADVVFTTGLYTTDPCCLQEGKYYIAFANVNNDSNFTVEVTSNVVSFTQSLTIGDTAIVPIPEQQTAQLSFTIDDLTYQAYTILVDATGDVDVAFQRISQAGTGFSSCYTNFDTESCNGLCYYRISKCAPYFIGTVYVSFTPASFSNETVTVTVVASDAINLSPDNNPVPLSAQAGVTYVYTIDVTLANLLTERQLFVTVSGPENNTVAYEVTLTGSSNFCDTDPELDSCEDDTSCSVSYSLCTAIQVFTLTIIADEDVDLSITAAIQASVVTPLQESVTTLKTDNSTDVNLYSFTVNDTISETEYVTVTIVYDGLVNPNAFTAIWTYYYPSPDAIYCLSDLSNSCTNYIQDPNGGAAGTTTCTFTIEPCQLYSGEFILEINAAQDTDTYALTYSIGSANSTTLTVGQVVYGAVAEYQNNYYQLPFDRSEILPGQSFEIVLEVTCGEAALFINQGELAGPLCSIAGTTTSYSLSACQLLESSETSSDSSNFYLTVSGGEQDYPEYGVLTSYSLSSSISGEEVSFVPIGSNQQLVFDGSNTIYTYSVSGINDFTGELAFTLSVESVNESSPQATVYISADVPYHTLLPCGTAPITLSTFIKGTQYIDSCSVDNVRIYYISFSTTSNVGATLTVSRTKQYVRDLNVYDEYPQSGAVVGKPITIDIVDEEYFEIEVNPNFNSSYRFQAVFTTPEFGQATLLTSLENQPSSCSDVEPAFSCSTDDSDTECVVTIDYCQFDSSATVPHVYLTVTSNYESSTPVPYNLTIAQYVNVTQLTVGTSVCGSSDSLWDWYYLPVQASSDFYEFQIYSISIGDTLTAYLNTQGLATNNCKEQQVVCNNPNGACGLIYSCDSFTGQFSLGIQKSSTSATYFVKVNKISVGTVVESLTVGTSHESEDDTPITIAQSDYYFYSFQTPTLDDGEVLLLSVVSESESVTVTYNNGSPSILCFDDSADGEAVAFFVNSCSYKSGVTVFVTVTGSSAFEIEVTSFATVAQAIAINANVEGSLTIDSSTDYPLPAFASYSFSLQDTDIQSAESFTISTYGINQGELSIWVTESQITDSECAFFVFTDSISTITLDSCQFTAGTYYVNVLLLEDAQNSPCVPVTFGILLTANSPAVPYVSVPLTSGAASSSSVFNTNNVYSYTVSNPNTSLVTLTTSSSAPLSVSSSCGLIAPTDYFFGCSAQSSFSFTVIPSPTFATLPSATYEITATTSTIPALTNTPTTYKFDYDGELQFFSFDVDEEVSLEIIVNVAVGPSVTISLWSSECDERNNNVLLDQFVCYYGACVLPISQRQGVVANTTDETTLTYYVTVAGYPPSSYAISINQGESETCEVPSEDDLSFCTIVTWSTWTFQSDEDNITKSQDATAEDRFNYLYNLFCPPCSCQGLSEACNTSLTEYVCTQTFRACDTDGFETSVCLTSCQDVEDNCGATFENVGLPELSCNHNFYLAEDDYICTDIYETTSSNSELILWIVVGVVLFIVVVVLISVAGVVIYKQVQAKKRASSYEVLE